MVIRYTRHAKQRMNQRKIGETQVAETLESPDEIQVGDRGEMIALRRYLFHEIRVVYEEIDAEIIVVFTVLRIRAQGE